MFPDLDWAALEQLEKDEATKRLGLFAVHISEVLDKMDTEISKLSKNGFDPGLMDRVARDLKADALDEISILLDKLID